MQVHVETVLCRSLAWKSELIWDRELRAGRMFKCRKQFEKLMEPGQIGPVKTRNRIIKTANGTSFMDFDTQGPGDRMVAYYERLAKGGVGYLMVESCGVEYPQGFITCTMTARSCLGACSCTLKATSYIPAFARIADAAHKHGCPCAVQLQHSGAWNPTGLLPKRDTAISSAFTKAEFPGPDFSRVPGHDSRRSRGHD